MLCLLSILQPSVVYLLIVALKDGETEDYVLNGNSIVSMFRKLILFGGTTLEYSGSDSVVERVNSSRPLNKDLIIEVSCVYVSVYNSSKMWLQTSLYPE